MTKKLIVAVAFVLPGLLVLPAQAQQPLKESPAQRDQRMAWWRQARFGMFIHWGVYAVPAGTYKGKQIGGIGEWIMRRAEIPVIEYRAFAKRFNPVKYDPDAWAALAEEAGMKYIVITSKHHDGFALFPSAATNWDIADATPYGKDLIGPLAEAARRHGLRFGLYYSQAQDWTHPGGAKAGLKDGQGWCEEHKGCFDEYLQQIAVPQTREILTHYRPDILWWDTPHLMTTERADLLRPLLDLRPGIITNNRLGGGYAGDTDTPEQHIPATGIAGRDWETCMTMNGTWGYKSYDDNWKSTETLIRNLVDIASKGGNYLLNVGPKPDGTIPQPSIERLKEVGRWMKINGPAIYATTASPTRRPAWGRITTKATGAATTLYLHVFDWPTDGQLPVWVTNKVLSCRLLSDPQRRFNVAQQEDGLLVKLTGPAPDPICSVVVLEVAGPAQAIIYRIPQQQDGSLFLRAVDAELRGTQRVESRYGDPNIGFWTNADDWIEWGMQIKQPAEFEAVADVATQGESHFTVQVGSLSLKAGVPNTRSYGKFQKVTLGRLRLDTAGACTLTIRPEKKSWSPVNLRSVVLKPVK